MKILLFMTQILAAQTAGSGPVERIVTTFGIDWPTCWPKSPASALCA
jgi:hypothetical protein